MAEQKEKVKRPLWRRIWRITWKTTMWFFIITISWVILYRWINPPTTFLQMSEACGCPDGSSFHKEWVDADKISNNMKLAVVSSEDNNFMKHHGVDWGAVEKAQKYNETIGKKKGKMRGASTITMQTAKNVFLWPGRTKIRKAFELYFTYLIEFFWSKERIMEVYLNVIEMGPCKFGVGAASQDYFGTTADKLTKEQAALIAACLPNPKKFNPGKPSGYMMKRQGQITRLMRMIGDGYFERYKDGVAEEEREKEEKATESKLQSIPEEDLPAVEPSDMESNEPSAEPDVPAEDADKTPEESAPADTTSQ